MKRRIIGAALVAALAACDGGSNVDGWRVDLDGDSGPLALSDLRGDQLTLRSFGREVHLDGVGSEQGRVVMSVPVGFNGPEKDDYKPSLFNVRWSDSEYTCVNNEDSISISFYGTDPARGVWEGQLICKRPDDNTDDAFLVYFDGAFKQTH
ncbi:hypothetical protein [Algiphilus aromaticivorans]|uniref:hypothetical protein n=1 Tax=Algiphilus aromaticivorans TaxID=382454 RepID=UPI0005C20919|nr:hypothetical protein [Algiphilus aromaticivorans]